MATTMSAAAASVTDVFRQAFTHEDLYNADTKPTAGSVQRFTGDMPRYTGDALFVDETGTRSIEGQGETSSSGDESFSGDEAKGQASPDRDATVLTPLETADVKYLSTPIDALYRPVDQNNVGNVVEFKSDVHAQNYSLPVTEQPDQENDAHAHGNLISFSNDPMLDNYGYKYPKDTDGIPRDVIRYPYSEYPSERAVIPASYPHAHAPSHHAYINTKPGVPQDVWPFEVNTPNPGKAGVFLCNRDLWERFHMHTTEMIVTKQGRRMFPVLEFSLRGLQPDKVYNVYVDLVLADNHHWKYQNSKWIPVGEAEQLPKTGRVYLHPDSPNSGNHWMKQDIVFNKLKLTNNKNSTGGQIVVNSMHKYQPRINVIEVGAFNTGDPKTLQTHFFAETQFITVTAYQNTDITQLKIDNNPFAKGFRDADGNNPVNKMYPGMFPGSQPGFPGYMYPQHMPDKCGYMPYLPANHDVKIERSDIPDPSGFFPNGVYPATADHGRSQFSPSMQYPYGMPYQSTESAEVSQNYAAIPQQPTFHHGEFQVTPSVQNGDYQHPVKVMNYPEQVYWPHSVKSEREHDFDEDYPAAKRGRYDTEDSFGDSDSS